MESKRDIVIVSCFGRGNWLASELAMSDYKVTLIDVSESMGRWTPEDWEGPFGFFHSPKLDSSQLARLSEEDYFDSVDEGFCIWLKNGPYNLKGSHSSHMVEASGISSETIEYLKNAPLGMSNNVKSAYIKSLKQTYDKNWLGHLSHNLAANKYLPNHESMESSSPLPLFESYFLRRVSRRGTEKSLDWVKDKGADVYRNAKIKDMEFQSNKFQSLEIQSEWSGVLQSEWLIWMLTGEETEMCSEKAKNILFPKGVAKPDWVWMRFRMRFKGNENIYLPLKFVMVEDVHLPWTHSNLCLVQKTTSANDYDVWVKIPEKQRFHREYVRELVDNVKVIIERRIPGVQTDCLELPQDYMYDFNELGPARFPVFSNNELKVKKPIKSSNIFFEQPEVWERLDWTGQFDSQNQTLKAIFEMTQKSKGVEA